MRIHESNQFSRRDSEAGSLLPYFAAIAILFAAIFGAAQHFNSASSAKVTAPAEETQTSPVMTPKVMTPKGHHK